MKQYLLKVNVIEYILRDKLIIDFKNYNTCFTGFIPEINILMNELYEVNKRLKVTITSRALLISYITICWRPSKIEIVAN